MSQSVGSMIKSALLIAVGSAVYAFGLHYFIIPNELMEGGVTGITLLIHYILGVPPSLTTLLLNIPLFALGWRMLGRTMVWTIVGTVAVSFFLWVMELAIGKGWIVPFHAPHDLFLVALYAGITLGGGLGLVFRAGGTTGGSDIVARIGNRTIGWSIGKMMLVFDMIVIGSSLLYISLDRVLYTLVVVFVASRVIDFIEEGAYAAKAFTIISDHSSELCEHIAREIDRGVTIFPAKGGYTKMNKDVLYCVVSRAEMQRLRRLVRQTDPRAFIIINDVHDVLGEGFRPE